MTTVVAAWLSKNLAPSKKYEHAYEDIYSNTDSFVDPPAQNVDMDSLSWYLTFWGMVVLVVEILLGFLAAYLSWTSNSLIGYAFPLKILFSVLSFFASYYYVLFYAIFRLDFVWLVSHSDKPKK
jgi:hypothetical protein